MKLLFVNPASAIYGSEQSMLALLSSRTFDAEVVCPAGGALEHELHELGIKVYPQEFGKYSLRKNPLWHLAFYHNFFRILKKSKPYVVVINLDGNTALIMLAATLAGIPVIRYSRFEFQPPMRSIERWCWQKARAVICPSELVRKQMLDWLDTNANANVKVFRLYDAYIGCDPSFEDVQTLHQELGLGQEKVIGCIGRLHPGKRIETAIESLAIVRKYGENTRLLIIGTDDGSPQGRAYCEELDQLAKKLSVSDFVTFTGYMSYEKIPAICSLMDVLVMPSESESFGMVLMEAWANGTPTVASDVSGCREITLASCGGFVVQVGVAKHFADRISSLLGNPLLATKMGQRGKQWVSENCSPTNYAESFSEILRKTIKRGKK